MQVQSLFGDPIYGTVGGHALFLERANRETDRQRKLSADLAFSAYIVTRLIDALLDLDQTFDSRAAFRWQHDVTAKHVSELPHDGTEASHLCGIMAEIPMDGQPQAALSVSLTAYAYFLEYEGRLEEALDILSLSARTRTAALPPTDLAAYALFAGKLNRLLSRWDQALTCYKTAEEAGRLVGDPTVMLRGRLHQGAVARGQGNFPKARTIAEEVAKEAATRGLGQVQGMAYADLSAVYSLMGQPLDAIRSAYAAFLVATTPVDRMSALGDLAISLAEIDATEQARLALQIVANAKTDFRLQTNAVIELMELESVAGNRLAFERHRATAEVSRDRMSPSMSVDYHFKTGVGLARFGIIDRARKSLAIALELAQSHELHAWYFRVEHVYNNLTALDAVQRPAAAPELRRAPVIYEVDLGLQEFSAATAATSA